MKKLYLSFTGAVTACIESDQEIRVDDTFHTLLHAYLPGAQIVDELFAQPTISIIHHEDVHYHVEHRERELVIHSIWNGEFNLEMFHVLYAMIREQLLAQSLYPVHGACVVSNAGRTILILGHSGSGKTSTVLELVQQHHYVVLSGNKTVIAFTPHMTAVAGTTSITTKNSDKERIQLPVKGFEYWDRYATFLSQEHYAHPPRTIDAIVMIALDDAHPVKANLKPAQTVHVLYPYFMDLLHANVVMQNGNDIRTVHDPYQISKQLVNVLQCLSIPIYRIVGTSAAIAHAITQI